MQLLIAVLVASFIGSLHCVGMCGPLVAFAVGDPNGGKARSSIWLHAAYHSGRLLTYMLVGAACGLLGAAIDRGGARLGMHRAAALVAGAMMVVVGLAAVMRATARGCQRDAAADYPTRHSCRPASRLCLGAAAKGPVRGTSDGAAAVRMALPFCFLCGRNRQSAMGRGFHGCLLAGQRAGAASGRRCGAGVSAVIGKETTAGYGPDHCRDGRRHASAAFAIARAGLRACADSAERGIGASS